MASQDFLTPYKYISPAEALRDRSASENLADSNYIANASSTKKHHRNVVAYQEGMDSKEADRLLAAKTKPIKMLDPSANAKHPSPNVGTFEDSPMLSQGEWTPTHEYVGIFGKSRSKSCSDLESFPTIHGTDTEDSEGDEARNGQGHDQAEASQATTKQPSLQGQADALGIIHAKSATASGKTPYRPPMIRGSAAGIPSASQKITTQPKDEEPELSLEHQLRSKQLVARIKMGNFTMPPELVTSGPIQSAPTIPSASTSMSMLSGQFQGRHRGQSSHTTNSMQSVQIGHGEQTWYTYNPRLRRASIAFANENDPIASDIARGISEGGITFEALMQYIPWTQKSCLWSATTRGVIRMTDIPYSSTRQEIDAFFGRAARFASSPPGSTFDGIHIMMERGTAKSHDCFVEFKSEDEAREAVQRVTKAWESTGRKPRIGDRTVRYKVVPHSEFMQVIFPHAKGMVWDGQNPVIVQASPNDPYYTPFRSFITNEEMHLVKMHATVSARSRFVTKHVQRTYESMITLLCKFPWWATEMYTVSTRNAMFDTVLEEMKVLTQHLIRTGGRGTIDLTPQLTEELLFDALHCPSFTEPQRAELYEASQGLVGMPSWVGPQAKACPFLGLQRRTDVSEQMTQVFMHYMQLAAWDLLDPAGKAMSATWDDPMSCVKALLGVCPVNTPMKNVCDHEMAIVEEIFRKIVELSGTAALPPITFTDLTKDI